MKTTESSVFLAVSDSKYQSLSLEAECQWEGHERWLLFYSQDKGVWPLEGSNEEQSLKEGSDMMLARLTGRRNVKTREEWKCQCQRTVTSQRSSCQTPSTAPYSSSAHLTWRKQTKSTSQHLIRWGGVQINHQHFWTKTSFHSRTENF